MDAISALNVAGAILAVAASGAELVSTSNKTQGALVPDDNEDDSIFKTLRTRRLTLSTLDGSLEQQLSASQSHPSSVALVALHGLALSCLEDSGSLLKEVEDKLRDFRGRERFHAMTGSKDWSRSDHGGRFDDKKVEWLSRAVTAPVSSIISSRITELSKTIESLKDGGRFARPELESQIDSMSRDLEVLGRELRIVAEDSDVKSPIAFTESEIQMFTIRLSSLTEAEDKVFADKIVASLNYDSRPVRHGSVPQAHKNTFQWAFDSRLSQWFRSGSGIFWVSGKPGSGKSTFMKFIASHGQTKELLASWSGSADIAVGAHFFWIAGTAIQKSWQGLLQSLLFDVLQKHSSVIPLISPTRWAAAKVGQLQTAIEPWSVTELMSALRALASAKNMPLKICFFIDGLDEYSSDHTELCNVLCDMASSPHIKMCVSSRPWAVFENSFGGNSAKRLDIHELTQNDIWRFVSDQLQGHHRWAAEDSKEASTEKAKLIEQIAANADGVFSGPFSL